MHKVAIPDFAVQRVIQRRGKLHVAEDFRGPVCALVVIDLQDGFMLPGALSETPAARDIVPNVNRLARAVRDAGGHVVWIRANLQNQREEWSSYFRRIPPEPAERYVSTLSPGGLGYPLNAALDVRPVDRVIDKARYSAFIPGTCGLDALLRKESIDTVIITGTQTNVCCESTARDAMMLNYNVAFVSDATATTTDEEHNATLANVLLYFGDVMTTNEVIDRLRPAPVHTAT